jgi:uncharacterized membrane protein
MDDETIDVLIGGYISEQAALEDFESVRGSGAYLHGATVVSKDLEGNLSVQLTDHIVRENAEGMALIGFALGLVVPPLVLASTAVGATMGAAIGKILHEVTAHELKHRAGATIPIGGAGLIVAYPKSSAHVVKPAVKRAISIAEGEAKGHHLRALTGALADAQHKMAVTTS